MTWGMEGKGLSPTSILTVRRDMARAAGCRKAGGCTTTAIGLEFGPAADPAIQLRVDILKSWVELLRALPDLRRAIEKAWRVVYDKMDVARGRHWRWARGPMGA
eukprot:8641098-Karenia_brevis.AAC.1